jgi:hypothetical protein
MGEEGVAGFLTMIANITIDSDQQQQEAALPQLVVARSFLRYVAQRVTHAIHPLF